MELCEVTEAAALLESNPVSRQCQPREESAFDSEHANVSLPVERTSVPALTEKKKYVYSEEQKQLLRSNHYKDLHAIDEYLRTQKYPDGIAGKTLRQNFRRKVKAFTLVSGQLHKKGPDQPIRVLWEQELESVLKATHEDWAHYPKDQNKFRAKVAQRFFFPQMVEICREFLSCCLECQHEKAGLRARTDRELNPPPPTSPFFRVHLDLCGPFKDKNKKKKFVMVVMDFVTKFSATQVLSNKKPETVANAFRREILERHGCPFEVVTDQGTEFNSAFAELLKASGLKHVKVSTRNPKANGQVERFMRILKSTLRATCHKFPLEWIPYVSKVTFQYNSTYQDTLRCSPFVCVYGREPILPADHLFPTQFSLLVGQSRELSVDEQETRVRTLHNIQERAKQNIEEYQRKAKENFSRWNKPKQTPQSVLKPGDYVSMRKPGNPRGFVLQWEGPYVFVGWADEQKLKACIRDDKGQEWHRSFQEIVGFKPSGLFTQKIIEPLLPAPVLETDARVRADLEPTTSLDIELAPLDVEPVENEATRVEDPDEIVLEFDSTCPENFPGFIPFAQSKRPRETEEASELPAKRKKVVPSRFREYDLTELPSLCGS